MVMNGPTPIMSIMFSAVADPSPIPRMRLGDPAPGCEEDSEEGCISWRSAAILEVSRDFGWRSAFSAAVKRSLVSGL